MANYLEPVSQKFIGDNSDLIKKIEEIKAAEKTLATESAKTSDSMAKDTDEVGKAFDGAGKKVTQFGQEAESSLSKSGRASSDFQRLVTSNMRDGETAIKAVRREFEATKKSYLDLQARARSTGDTSILFGDLKKSYADLQKLASFGKSMGVDLMKDGEEAGGDFVEGFSQIKGPMIGVVVGGIALATPLILGAVASAVSAGIGSLGIAAGIAAAAHDPRVQGAFGELKTEASGIWHDIGDEFVGPVVSGITDIKQDLSDIAPDLKATFGALAKDTRPLIDGVGGFVKSMLPGLEEAFRNASPYVQELARDLPLLGQKIGEMFDDFTSGGPGAMMALRELIGGVGELASVIGKTVEYGSKAWTYLSGVLATSQGNFGGWVETLEQAQGALNPSPWSDVAEAAIGLASANAKAAQSLNDLITADNKWLSLAESSDNATLSFHEALTAFNKELKSGKTSWDMNTQAGQQTVSTFYQAVDALTSLNPTTEKGIASSKRYAEQMLKQAQQSGATGEETVTLKAYIKQLGDELTKIKSKKVTVSINEKYTTHFINEGTPPSQFAHGLAEGGLVRAASGLNSGILPPRSPGTLVLAGEQRTGGEIFAPLRGISQSRAMALAGVLGDAYDFDVTPRVAQTAMLGASSGYAGVGAAAPIVVHSHVYLDGKEIHSNQIVHAQRYKLRTGTTGLT